MSVLNLFEKITLISLGMALLLMVCTGCNTGVNDKSDQHTTWENYGGGPDQSKYVVLDDITKSNVHQLKEAWFYPTRDNKTYNFNPIVVDTVMYVLARNNSLVALDARNGKEIWIHSNLQDIAWRGINFYTTAPGIRPPPVSIRPVCVRGMQSFLLYSFPDIWIALSV